MAITVKLAIHNLNWILHARLVKKFAVLIAAIIAKGQWECACPDTGQNGATWSGARGRAVPNFTLSITTQVVKLRTFESAIITSWVKRS